MPVAKGQQTAREKVDINLDIIQETIDRLESNSKFINRTAMFRADPRSRKT